MWSSLRLAPIMIVYTAACMSGIIIVYIPRYSYIATSVKMNTHSLSLKLSSTVKLNINVIKY